MPVLPHTYDQGTAPPGNNDLSGDQPVHDGDPEGSLYLGHGLPDGLLEITIEVSGDQMGEDLRIRVRPERDARLFQLLFEGMEVFYDAVMDHKHVSVLITVGMGVFLGRLPVGCPSRVCDAGGAMDIQVLYLLLQFNDFSYRPIEMNLLLVLNSESCRVIAAVFQTFQALYQDGLRRFKAHITYNTAHK